MSKKLQKPDVSPQKALKIVLANLQKHTAVVIAIIAGLFIGYAIFSVNSISQTTDASLNQTDSAANLPLSSLNIDDNLRNRLESLSEDQDVTIGSNIASYRRSAFSDTTEESQWTIEAATALESYYADNENYPS